MRAANCASHYANKRDRRVFGGLELVWRMQQEGYQMSTPDTPDSPNGAVNPDGVESTDEEFVPSAHPRGTKNGRKVLVVLAALILVLGSLIGVGAWWINSKFGQIEQIADPFTKIETPRPEPVQPEDERPVNILILGSDSRTSGGDLKAIAQGGTRSDALMIMQISGDRGKVNVMSIPRDSWVPIPGHGDAKINAALAFGGPSLAISTVEQLTNIPIDHVALMDFTSFVKLTDLVGGVDLTSTTEGTKHYSGAEALAFVRERKSLVGGDFDRVRRQQLWMSTVMKQVLTADTLNSPTKILDLYNAMSPYVAVDDSLGMTEIASLAASMTDVRSDDFQFITVPVAGTGTSADGQSIVNLDMDRAAPLFDAFVQDNATSYIAANQGELRSIDSEPVR